MAYNDNWKPGWMTSMWIGSMQVFLILVSPLLIFMAIVWAIILWPIALLFIILLFHARKGKNNTKAVGVGQLKINEIKNRKSIDVTLSDTIEFENSMRGKLKTPMSYDCYKKIKAKKYGVP